MSSMTIACNSVVLLRPGSERPMAGKTGLIRKGEGDLAVEEAAERRAFHRSF